MRSVGEPFSEEEMAMFMMLATDNSSDKPTLIDIKRFADIILPPVVVQNDLKKGLAKN
jgi:hypothetical protein